MNNKQLDVTVNDKSGVADKLRKGKATTHVFLSYSRKDAHRLEPLVEKLRAADINVFRDSDDILPAEEWRSRLENLIIKADQLIFALSPASALSEECNWELQVAERLHKRIVPVVVSDLGDVEVPDSLSKLNYIFLTPPADYNESINQLISSLMINIAWVREHARLGELAQRWERAKHSNDQLLRGKPLEQAETWLTTPSGDAPVPTLLHRQFITASRQEMTRRNRRNVLVLGGLLVLSMISGAVAWVQYGNAEREARRFIKATSLAAWKPLEDPKAACVNMRQYTGQEGLRALYCHVRDMLSYRTVETMSGMPVFLYGPHQDGKLYVQENNFGYYNPEFVAWFRDHLIPDGSDPSYIQMTQGLYDSYLRDLVRAFYRSYVQFTKNPDPFILERQYLTAMIDGTRDWSYLGARWQAHTVRELLDINMATEGLNFHHMSVAIRFWQRRSIDGTSALFFNIIDQLAAIYDTGWYNQQSEPQGSLPAAGETTDWRSDLLPEPQGELVILNPDVFGGVIE